MVREGEFLGEVGRAWRACIHWGGGLREKSWGEEILGVLGEGSLLCSEGVLEFQNASDPGMFRSLSERSESKGGTPRTPSSRPLPVSRRTAPNGATPFHQSAFHDPACAVRNGPAPSLGGRAVAVI